MPTLKELKEEHRRLADSAWETFRDTDLTTEERATRVAKMKADLETSSKTIVEIEKAKEDESFLEEQRKRYAPLGSSSNGQDGDAKGANLNDGGAPVVETRSLGTQFVESQQYKAFMASGGIKGQSWQMPAVEIKTTLTEGAGSGTALVQPDVRPGILPLLFRRLVVADLIPQGTTSSNTVRYIKETSFTNAASTVTETGVKPESAIVFDQVDEPVRKIAHWIPVSDEMLEDVAQIRSYLDNRLVLGLMLQEETELLSGNGVAPDLQGLLNRTGLQTAQALGGDSRADCIFKAVTKIRLNAFMEPDVFVVHPSDWQDIRLEKDQNNQYYGGGPWTGTYGQGAPTSSGSVGGGQPSYWGLTPVVTPVITAGTVLVGAFGQAAQIFRRGGVTVDATNSHASNFISNITVIRAEMREALAVFRPGGFGTCTGV